MSQTRLQPPYHAGYVPPWYICLPYHTQVGVPASVHASLCTSGVCTGLYVHRLEGGVTLLVGR